MKKAFDAPLNQDLREFTAILWEQGIAHRVVEVQGRQECWLADDRLVGPILMLYRAFCEDHDHWNRLVEEMREARVNAPQKQVFSVAPPVTLTLLLLSACIGLLTGLGSSGPLLHVLSFVDPQIYPVHTYPARVDALLDTLAGGEIWRLVTPAFLHFSVLHILFNMLWLLELGRRIENRQSGRRLLVICTLTALLSNTAQYLVSGPFFGGMSGVVYGLLGYCWIWSQLHPAQHFGLPRGIVIFMLVWLVIGVTGVTEWLGIGAMANTAHGLGLLGGILCAVMFSRPTVADR